MAKVIKNYESLTTKIGLLICLLVTIVTLSLIFLFKYADYIEKEEKNILLTEYNRKILELSKKEINKVFYHLSASFENPEISIKINDRTLNACYQGRCHKYNLLSFAKLLQLSIPEFIDFKIMLNNNVMDFRNHHTQYEKENSYKLNENYKIFINTFVDKEFWDKRKSLIKKPYWIIGITLILNSVALYLIFRYLFKIYTIRYQKIYHKETAQKEENLLKKIWELGYQKQKEKDLQYLFACKANKLAHKNFSEKDVTVKSLPCSIILQEGNIKEERIDLNKTTDLFLNVFIRSEGSFTIEKTSEGIKFESRELFYQFIYSILSYLFFLSPKSDISLYMREQSDETTVSFLINGMNISSKKELLVYSDKYFKSHGNVFILDINQVFYLLKQKGFRCKVVRDKDMFIIKLNKSKIQKNSDMKNVISIKREKR